MNESALADMETFFMALADKTRLRLLNLMRDEEVCVCFFTEVLGDSQPKISRHLAYLRNSGIVEARRDGKWMHYSIVPPKDENERRVLNEVFEWLDSRDDMRLDREKYRNVCCSPELLVQIARTPIDFINPAPETAEVEYASAASAHNEIDEFLL